MYMEGRGLPENKLTERNLNLMEITNTLLEVEGNGKHIELFTSFHNHKKNI